MQCHRYAPRTLFLPRSERLWLGLPQRERGQPRHGTRARDTVERAGCRVLRLFAHSWPNRFRVADTLSWPRVPTSDAGSSGRRVEHLIDRRRCGIGIAPERRRHPTSHRIRIAGRVIATREQQSTDRCHSVRRGLQTRMGMGHAESSFHCLPSAARTWIGQMLLRSHWFTRHVVLDRWFLNNQQTALSL